MKSVQSALELDAEFGRSDSKSHHLRFKDFDSTKNADEIRAAMSKLTKLSIFDKNDINLFDEVRHATVIEKQEREIFDKKKETGLEPVAAESVKEPVQPKSEPIPQVKEPVNHIEATEDIRISEDLNIMLDYPKPGWFIETIELPTGFGLQDISESDSYRLIASCLPPRVLVENIEVDEQATPVRLIITGKLETEESIIEQVAAPNKESPPVKPKKKRKRLLERVRKRE